VNLDVHEGDGVFPDVLVEDVSRPLAAYADGTVSRVYMGHVLEHVPWPEVGAFLADIARALHPAGELCVVGPDLLRTIEGWHGGTEPWQLVESVMESPWPYANPDQDGETWACANAWTNARHWWNCYEARVVWALEATGLFAEVKPRTLDAESLGTWPVVAYTPWQCAVTGVRADA
jgi:hypothetical protein